MKKLYLLCAILIALTSGSNAQSHTGSMIWKWDTVICYNEQDLVIERLIQSFDENGFVTGQLNEKRTSGEWVNDSRITNTNNAGGKVISSLTQLWQSNAWLNYSRVSVEYDFNGHIILESVEKFSGANWVNYIKRSYSYDGLGRKISMLQERWAPGTWKNDLKSDYAYESNLLTVITQYSDDGLNWLNGSRFIYTYNENGYYDELLIHSWDENQWVAANKVDYTVDDGGNILTEWAYNPSGIGWVSDSRKTYTHDTFGNTLTGKNEIWSSGTWQPDMQTSYLYYKNEYVLLLNVQTYRFEASYKGFPLGYDNKAAFNFKLFPNPADNIVRIDGLMVIPEGNVISVSDMHGRILKKVDLKTGETIVELGDIISGHYLFTIESKSGMRSGKLLIIQH